MAKVRATHEKRQIVEENVDVLHVASGKNKSSGHVACHGRVKSHDRKIQKQVIRACRVSRTCEITRLNNVIKAAPNILTLTDAPSRGQKVGDSDVATFFHSR